MIDNIVLKDFVKDYEENEFNDAIHKNRKINKPIKLSAIKNESKRRKVDKTPINISEYENRENVNNKLQEKFNEIMNDIRLQEEKINNYLNDGKISLKQYNKMINDLSELKKSARNAYLKNAK